MKVSDYIPKLYKNNIEMTNIINSEEQEFETHLKNDIDNSFKDTFAKTATEVGIQNYEKLLEIPLDENKNNLEYRRARVLSKLSTSGNLTFRWLENNLKNLVGENNYQVLLNAYDLYINISDVYLNTAKTLYEIYRPLIPSNLNLYVNLFDIINNNLYLAGIIHEGEDLFIKGEELT